MPNAIFDINHDTTFQIVAAIIGGYRYARTAETQTEDGRVQGLFAAVNFNYLRGFNFDQIQMDVQFETNSAGIIPNTATRSTPLALDFLKSTEGNGLAIDAGVIYAVERWELGLGVNGIANRITWTGVERRRYIEENLSGGDNPSSSDPVPFADVTVELPINISSNVGYHANSWSAMADWMLAASMATTSRAGSSISSAKQRSAAAAATRATDGTPLPESGST